MTHYVLQDYEFNWDRMLQVEGDTGALLMYTYARLRGIEEHCGLAVRALTSFDVYRLTRHLYIS